MAVKIKEQPDFVKARSPLLQQVLVIHDQIAIPEHLKKMAHGKKFFIRTFGCQANVRDEETIAGLLIEAGFEQTNIDRKADLIIFNTCAVRESAESKAFGAIGTLKSYKREKKDIVIAVGGCMVQQSHVITNLIDKHRHVDLMFGTHNIHQLLDLLDEVYTNRDTIVAVPSITELNIEPLPVKRKHSYKAFVNIMFGCDKFCTYCIVPYTRGRERSRQIGDVLNECQQLINEGYQEITLLGQNVNAYGKDFKDGTSFATLLEKVALLGIARLRFTTSHPWDFTSEMINVIAKYPNIMKAIHLPFQAGDDKILRLMGRRYSKKSYLALINEIKRKIPNIALTTDIIVGFPNETEAQFVETLDVVDQVGFDGCFTFIYSPRMGTPASRIIDNVSLKEKHERFNRLVKVVEAKAIIKANQLVGQVVDVLVEGPSEKDKTVLSGYSEANKLIHFKGPPSLIGQIVKVKIHTSKLYSMHGDLLSERS